MTSFKQDIENIYLLPEDLHSEFLSIIKLLDDNSYTRTDEGLDFYFASNIIDSKLIDRYFELIEMIEDKTTYNWIITR